MHIPETQYTQSGEISIAYQVVGTGPIDLVVVPGFVSHLEQAWEDPSYTRFLNQLASFSRLILFDKRGTGLSDRIVDIPTLDERMDDVRAVMDAVGTERAAIFGISEGGPMGILFAATYPDRVSNLILYGSIARGSWAPDYPWGPECGTEAMEDWYEAFRTEWGSPIGIDYWAPTMAEDKSFRQWWAKYLRLAASPAAVINVFRMNEGIDVRDILPSVRISTLVLHRKGDMAVNAGQGQYIAERIPNAQFVPLKGNDHLWWVGDSDSILSAIQEFLTGEEPAQDMDRILATVLFVDIAESTKQAAVLGDKRWKDILDSHNDLVKKEVSRYRGRLIKCMGDGYLAVFDGPGRAIQCGKAICDESNQLDIAVRTGLHTGEIDLKEKDVGGIAVHIAARVMEMAAPNEVWVSRTVKDLVAGSGFRFNDQGMFELKGVPEIWNLYLVSE